MDIVSHWSVLKNVLASMYHDHTILRSVIASIGVVGVMELVKEAGLSFSQEDIIAYGLKFILGETIRRMATKSDPQLLAGLPNHPKGFRPLF